MVLLQPALPTKARGKVKQKAKQKANQKAKAKAKAKVEKENLAKADEAKAIFQLIMSQTMHTWQRNLGNQLMKIGN